MPVSNMNEVGCYNNLRSRASSEVDILRPVNRSIYVLMFIRCQWERQRYAYKQIGAII